LAAGGTSRTGTSRTGTSRTGTSQAGTSAAWGAARAQGAVMVLRILVVLGVAATVGLLIFYLWQAPGASGADSGTGEAAAREPGYTAIGAQLLEMGDNGQPLYRLDAVRIEQPRPNGDISVLEPRVVYDPAVGNPWTLRAMHGVLPADARSAQLSGDVEVQGIPQGSRVPVTIRTELLNLDISHQQATSNERVQIDWGGGRVSGRGLFADMKGDNLQLKSDVHGQSAPRASAQ
jgi:LPS export ABC transporter protein LptC